MGRGRLSIKRIRGNTLHVNSNWAPSTHRVVFNMVVDGNRLYEVQTIEVEHGSTLNGMPYVSRLGYTFAGWYDQLIDGNPLTAYIRITEDKTYYAHWTEGETSGGGEEALPLETFHFNVGYPVGQCDIRSVTVQHVHSMSEEQANKYIPSCPGNEFLGWFYQPVAIGRIDSNGNTAESSWDWPGRPGFPLLGKYGSVVAHWALETSPDEPIDNPESDFHTVYFDSSISLTAGPFQMKVRHGTSITKEQVDEMFVPKCQGGTFLGWHDSPDVDSETVFPIQVNDDVHLYAHWYVVPLPDPRVCKVFLDGGNSYGIVPVPSYLAEIRYGTVLTEDDINNMFQPSVDGNEFIGWYGSIDGDDKIAFPITVKSDTILYAHWKAIEYPITYDMNGHGEPNPNNRQSYTINDFQIHDATTNRPVIESYVPDPPEEVEGWDFTGWTLIVPDDYTNGICFRANWIEIGGSSRIVYSSESGLPDVLLNVTSLVDIDAIPDVEEMTELHIGTGVSDFEYTSIFQAKKLRKVEIPRTLSLTSGAFSYNYKIDEFIVDKDNPTCKSVNGMLLSKDGKTLIHGVNHNSEIPDSVEVIGSGAFQESDLKEITIPENVIRINLRAFRHSGIEKLTFERGLDGIQEIQLEAFSECTSLKEVAIPNNGTNYGNGVFMNDGLEKIEFLKGFATIPYGICTRCHNLKTVIMPEGVTAISQYAFSGCNGLEEIIFPESLSNIEEYAFSGCSSLGVLTFLGNAPQVVNSQQYPLRNSFYGIPENAVAYVNPQKSGWPAAGEKWNGMTIQYFDPETPPVVPTSPVDYGDEDEDFGIEDNIEVEVQNQFDTEEWQEIMDEIKEQHHIDAEPLDEEQYEEIMDGLRTSPFPTAHQETVEWAMSENPDEVEWEWTDEDETLSKDELYQIIDDTYIVSED